MLFTTSLCLLLLFWTSLFLLDYYLRINHVQWYLDFSDRSGLQVSLAQFRFYVSRFDGSHFFNSYSTTVRRWKNSRNWMLAVDTWFSVGAFVALCCFVLATLYLSYLLVCEVFNFIALFSVRSWHQVRVSSDGNYHSVGGEAVDQGALSYVPYQSHVQSGITPVIPGVNIPMEHLPLFMSVLIIAGIIHEIGHAFAAASSNVRVTGFGIFLYGIYPGAFTEIDTGELERATPAQKLRIYSAGIWHNLILALLGYIFYLLVPTMCLLLFKTGAGVLVTDISSNSGLVGPSGLQYGHVISQLNGCNVYDKQSYLRCLARFEADVPRHGYYLPASSVFPLTASSNMIQVVGGETGCCQEFENITTSSHICFQYVANRTAKDQKVTPAMDFGEHLGLKNRAQRAAIGGDSDNSDSTAQSKGINLADYNFACLPAREVTDHVPCSHDSVQEKNGEICVYPAMYNGTVLLRFDVANSTRPIIFIGQISEARFLLNLQELIPRSSWIPYSIPGALELACKYVITFSLALGLLNAVPCHGLDGHWIADVVVDYFFGSKPITFRDNVSGALVLYGTTVFLLNVMIGFLKFVVIHTLGSL
uniref:Membrane-bound transcription factor site-2 protease n=1 Tax=Panagrellus redivivus TaxID=6233 RepID=A0A7E4W2P6_PANRE